MTSAGPAGTQTIAGVPVELGQPVHVNTKKQLQRQINAIVGWNELDRAPMNVAQTMLRGNEQQIGEHPYFVCEKSVGVRYLALLVQGRCYLISQNYEIREVTLFCPVRPDRLQPGVDRNTVVPHQWTILDGLMVCDKDGNKSVLTLLLYDILALNGSPVMTSKLQDRLKLIQNDVVGPRKQLPPPKGQPPDMFQLVLQSMYPINRVGHVIRSILPRVSQTRQNAGLVFTPVLLPYTPGYSKGLYNWTPSSVLFADFQLGVEWRGRPPKPGFKLIIHDKRTQIFHDWITFAPGRMSLYWRMNGGLNSSYLCMFCHQMTSRPSDRTRKRLRVSWSVCTIPSGSRTFRHTIRAPGLLEARSLMLPIAASDGGKVRQRHVLVRRLVVDLSSVCLFMKRWLEVYPMPPRSQYAARAQLSCDDRESNWRRY
ncbi:hypothetical protein, variant 4 [Phytophthora nicotianae INRA-310]|uniref:mRNA capping enzyme adenylation domain-containing protein n=1 Tax=Phytophthora nicotianae (strain INRA-310) TaxID=761204 RepID=W2R939_PHYN3|nr:hypothetical protein, variant 4 [Phytophthora nicotianae INRA-310]ETN21045.1 hypothetical protein, variant 4 [Phytophthora nicotianae INRA-310]